MSEERKSREMHLKESIEDNEQVSVETGTPYEESTSSKVNENFDQSLRRIIKSISYKTTDDKLDINCDLIKLLGDFLDIRDYNSNLFSSWFLTTLHRYLITFSNKMRSCDYKIFIYWLFEEINILRDNPEMSREEFFALMNDVFYKALAKILDGKGLLLLSEFIRRPTDAEEMNVSSIITLTESDSNRTPIMENDEKTKVDSELMNIAPQEEFKNRCYENLLHVVIEATYEIFGKEVDYMLIQSTINEQDNVLYYTIPYHTRKPRVVKKTDALKKMSITSTSKTDKSKKKRKSVKKKSIIETPECSIASILYQSNYILPLSEALESYDVMHSNGNETTKRISDALSY